MPDGTSRFSTLEGGPILDGMGCSTFANHTVLTGIAVAKLREDAPVDRICRIGRGATTGIGAVINTARVWIGAGAAVFDLGGIGLCVVRGLRLAGAGRIIGVDIHPARAPMAERLRMTHCLDPAEAVDAGAEISPRPVQRVTGGREGPRLRRRAGESIRAVVVH